MLIISRQQINTRHVVTRAPAAESRQESPSDRTGSFSAPVRAPRATPRAGRLRPTAPPRLTHVRSHSPAPKGTSLRISNPMASAIRTIISKSLLVPDTSPAFLTNCTSPKVLVNVPDFLVSIRRRQHNIGHESRFSQEHVLHHDKGIGKSERVNGSGLSDSLRPRKAPSTFRPAASIISATSIRLWQGRAPTPGGTCRYRKPGGTREGNPDTAPCRPRRENWHSPPGRRIWLLKSQNRTSPAQPRHLPRNSEPNTITRFCSLRSLSRKANQPSGSYSR